MQIQKWEGPTGWSVSRVPQYSLEALLTPSCPHIADITTVRSKTIPNMNQGRTSHSADLAVDANDDLSCPAASEFVSYNPPADPSNDVDALHASYGRTLNTQKTLDLELWDPNFHSVSPSSI
jgi:hypothetical protein